MATLIQGYDTKNHFIFDQFKKTLEFYIQTDATLYDCINTIYQFILPFLDNKMSIFEKYGAFKEEYLVICFSYIEGTHQ